jgi:short-subunit dehydrogenase
MTGPMRFPGRVAVVTGAASGIGRGIARSLARRGCALALADIDEDGLVETKRLIANGAAKVSLHRLDVADRAAVGAFPEAVQRAHGRVDLLVNNAGVALGGNFEELSEQDFEWLFGVNFWGVVRMTRVFLPQLRASDDARIVNLSSIFGIIAPPGQTAYVASKFAVRGFSNALMRELEGSSVGLTVVHPGGVATAIAEHARRPNAWSPEQAADQLERSRRLLRLAPEIAGETIVQGVERRRRRLVVGVDAQIVAALERLTPVSNMGILMKAHRFVKAFRS